MKEVYAYASERSCCYIINNTRFIVQAVYKVAQDIVIYKFYDEDLNLSIWILNCELDFIVNDEIRQFLKHIEKIRVSLGDYY